MRTSGLVGTALAASIGLVALAGCSPTQNSEIVEGSQLSVAWNQPFYAYNTNTASGNASANFNIVYLANSSFNYYDSEPKLVRNTDFGTYEKVSENPLTVKYTVNDGISWSDGTRLDSADLLLSWVANSGAYNEINSAEVKKDSEGAITNEEQIKDKLFFDSKWTGSGIDTVSQLPATGDGNRSMTLVYDAPYVDWETALPPQTVPAHVTVQHAYPEKNLSADEAKQQLITAIQNKDIAWLKPVANFWNRGYDMASMPSDRSLVLSSGAYTMTDFVEKQYITLTANENYKGPNPAAFQKLTVRFIQDPLAQVQALQNGEVDIISPQATQDILSALSGVQGVTVKQNIQASYEHVDLTFNNGGPFDPATYGGDTVKAQKVREAFLLTIPRQEILNKLIKPIDSNAVLRNSYTQIPGTPRYDQIVAGNDSSLYAQTDIAKASTLLSEAGVSTPVDVRFLYGKSNTRRANEFQLIAASAAQAGFNVIDGGDDKWASLLGSGTYDAALFAWESEDLAVTESSANNVTGGGNNKGGYSSPQVDALYEQLSGEFDTNKQTELLTQVEKHLSDDAFGLTIYQFPGVAAWSDRVTGVVPAPLSPTFFWNYWEWRPTGGSPSSHP